MRVSRFLHVFKWTMYTVATLQFLRSYILGTAFYLDLPAYLSGRERLPFQERVLPIFFMKLVYRSPWIMQYLTHKQGLFGPQTGPFFLLSLFSIVLSCFFILKLYRAVSPYGILGVLVYPIFLISMMLTYSNHLEQNYSYPYDFLSIAFFTAGLYFIYTRRFVPVLIVILLGTLNRETTLFLIGIYALDAATVVEEGTENATMLQAHLWQRLSLKQVPWLRFALLLAIWVAIKLTLAYLFAHNDKSEDHLRFQENMGRLQLRLLPEILNLCGYLLPVVWILRNRIRPTRFGNYIYILPVWFAVMFCTGVIVEVRIYGELCSYAAVAIVVLLECHTARLSPATPSATSIQAA